jgi:hypothetical protein
MGLPTCCFIAYFKLYLLLVATVTKQTSYRCQHSDGWSWGDGRAALAGEKGQSRRQYRLNRHTHRSQRWQFVMALISNSKNPNASNKIKSPCTNASRIPSKVTSRKRFNDLMYFKVKYGHCDFSQIGEYVSLGKWCTT